MMTHSWATDIPVFHLRFFCVTVQDKTVHVTVHVSYCRWVWLFPRLRGIFDVCTWLRLRLRRSSVSVA